MKKLVKQIAKGRHIGKTFYVCDLRMGENPFGDLQRDIPPQKVVVKMKDDLPARKEIYYSEAFLTPYSQKDLKNVDVISLFDNVQYSPRTNTPFLVGTRRVDLLTGESHPEGLPLQVFRTMEEAEYKYAEQRQRVYIEMQKVLGSYKKISKKFKKGS